MAAFHGPEVQVDLRAQSRNAESTSSKSIEDPVVEVYKFEAIARCEYAAKAQGLCSDDQVTLFQESLSKVLYNDRISDAGCVDRCRALQELLNARGQRLSVDQEQMFSFALKSVLQTSKQLTTTLEATVLTPKNPVTPQPKEQANACV